MSPGRLEHLLCMVGPLISKGKCRSREAIAPAERLVINLRYLASGNSQQSESFNFRVGRSAVCMIIHETGNAIWIALHKHYLRFPASQEEWKFISNGFRNEWDFPACLGTLDGKHIAIECPKNEGSNFYKYKNFHSIVLMAICDSKCCFSYVHIGGYETQMFFKPFRTMPLMCQVKKKS